MKTCVFTFYDEKGNILPEQLRDFCPDYFTDKDLDAVLTLLTMNNPRLRTGLPPTTKIESKPSTSILEKRKIEDYFPPIVKTGSKPQQHAGKKVQVGTMEEALGDATRGIMYATVALESATVGTRDTLSASPSLESGEALARAAQGIQDAISALNGRNPVPSIEAADLISPQTNTALAHTTTSDEDTSRSSSANASLSTPSTAPTPPLITFRPVNSAPAPRNTSSTPKRSFETTTSSAPAKRTKLTVKQKRERQEQKGRQKRWCFLHGLGPSELWTKELLSWRENGCSNCEGGKFTDCHPPC